MPNLSAVTRSGSSRAISAEEDGKETLDKISSTLDRIPVFKTLETRTGVSKLVFAWIGVLVTAVVCGAVFGVHTICDVVAFIYPAYRSYKVLEAKDTDAQLHWLTYWVVYGCFNVAEVIGDLFLFWLPYYYVGKMGFLVWCFLPRRNGRPGCVLVYEHLLRPFLIDHQDQCEYLLVKTTTFLSKASQEIQDISKDLLATWAGTITSSIYQALIRIQLNAMTGRSAPQQAAADDSEETNSERDGLPSNASSPVSNASSTSSSSTFSSLFSSATTPSPASGSAPSKQQEEEEQQHGQIERDSHRSGSGEEGGEPHRRVSPSPSSATSSAPPPSSVELLSDDYEFSPEPPETGGATDELSPGSGSSGSSSSSPSGGDGGEPGGAAGRALSPGRPPLPSAPPSTVRPVRPRRMSHHDTNAPGSSSSSSSSSSASSTSASATLTRTRSRGAGTLASSASTTSLGVGSSAAAARRVKQPVRRVPSHR